jgi:hypothetical protein
VKESGSFLEKKNQKTFAHRLALSGNTAAESTKVFCFFFSKKQALLPLAPASTHLGQGRLQVG